MPIYEYACKNCDTKFEKLVRSMNSSEKVDCPKCGSTKTARALSVFAVGAKARAARHPKRPCAADAAGRRDLARCESS